MTGATFPAQEVAVRDSPPADYPWTISTGAYGPRFPGDEIRQPCGRSGAGRCRSAGYGRIGLSEIGGPADQTVAQIALGSVICRTENR